jgi:hypothetical protein
MPKKRITVTYNVGSAVNVESWEFEGDYEIERIAAYPGPNGTRKTLIKTPGRDFHCDSYQIKLEDVWNE